MAQQVGRDGWMTAGGDEGLGRSQKRHKTSLYEHEEYANTAGNGGREERKTLSSGEGD